MIAVKTALTLLAVLILAGATIAMAMSVAGDLMPMWMAAAGPMLLAATVYVHMRGRKG